MIKTEYVISGAGLRNSAGRAESVAAPDMQPIVSNMESYKSSSASAGLFSVLKEVFAK